MQYRPAEEADGVTERKSNFWKVFPLLRAIGNLEAKWNAALDSLLVCEIFNFNSIPFGVDSFIAAPPLLLRNAETRRELKSLSNEKNASESRRFFHHSPCKKTFLLSAISVDCGGKSVAG